MTAGTQFTPLFNPGKKLYVGPVRLKSEIMRLYGVTGPTFRTMLDEIGAELMESRRTNKKLTPYQINVLFAHHGWPVDLM